MKKQALITFTLLLALLGLTPAPAQATSAVHVHTKVSVATKRAKAYKIAKSSYKGVRYKTGGTSRKGWDCSGYVTYVYKRAGIKSKKSSRWTTRTIKKDRKLKRTKKPKPGDIVYNSPSHVGIYIGKRHGKPYMISARNPRKGTTQHPVRMASVKTKNIKYYTIKA